MKIALNLVLVAIWLIMLHGTIFLVLDLLERRGVRIPPRLRRHFLPWDPPTEHRPRH